MWACPSEATGSNTLEDGVNVACLVHIPHSCTGMIMSPNRTPLSGVTVKVGLFPGVPFLHGFWHSKSVVFLLVFGIITRQPIFRHCCCVFTDSGIWRELL